MSWIDTAQINALTNLLDVSSARHRVITTNLANIDTPNFHTKDLNFKTMLQQANSGGLLQAGSSPAVSEVQGLMERPDGNNVSLERESLLLAQNQLQYRTGTQLLRSEFHRLSLAINEGK